MKKALLLFVSFIVLLSSCATRMIKVENLKMQETGVYETGLYDESAAEIVEFYAPEKKVFFTNGKDGSLVILQDNNGTLTEQKKISFDQGDVNSVSVHGNLAAVAVADGDKTRNGKVYFINASSGEKLGSVAVGALPDMVTFSPDGKYVLSANEGEPNEEYKVDPVGSVSIIKVNAVEPSMSVVTTLTFSESVAAPSESGIPVRTHDYLKEFRPDYSFAKDIEPEYIAVDGKSKYAYVSCQENNAVAKIDIVAGKVVTLKSLGYKDYTSCGVDFIEDGKAEIVSEPYYGIYMPDSITTFEVDGKTYIATANEGDDRADWEDGTEFEDHDVAKAKSLIKDFGLTLDASLLNEKGELKSDYKSVRVSPYDCVDTDGDGDIDILVGFGGRSFTIWDENLNKVYDSGSLFETYTAGVNKSSFNSSNDNLLVDDRSPKKGPEPEAIAAGKIGGTPLLFVGLERFGGIFSFDVSVPAEPKMLDYVTSRNLKAAVDAEGEYTDTSSANTGDLGPEGFHFISADESGTGNAQLVVGNEVSGTVRVYSLITE